MVSCRLFKKNYRTGGINKGSHQCTCVHILHKNEKTHISLNPRVPGMHNDWSLHPHIFATILEIPMLHALSIPHFVYSRKNYVHPENTVLNDEKNTYFVYMTQKKNWCRCSNSMSLSPNCSKSFHCLCKFPPITTWKCKTCLETYRCSAKPSQWFVHDPTSFPRWALDLRRLGKRSCNMWKTHQVWLYFESLSKNGSVYSKGRNCRPQIPPFRTLIIHTHGLIPFKSKKDPQFPRTGGPSDLFLTLKTSGNSLIMVLKSTVLAFTLWYFPKIHGP